MSFLKRLFGRGRLDGEALAQSATKSDYAQIELLSHFVEPRSLHSSQEQQRWNRILPRDYAEHIELFHKQGWLITSQSETVGQYSMDASAQPIIEIYQRRLAAERTEVMPKVRKAIEAGDTGEALQIRRSYEARQPLGKAEWSGPEPQLSHSALTRRILFLDHPLANDLEPSVATWLKQYAAEQHLWGVYWQLQPDEIPENVKEAVQIDGMPDMEAVYWRAYQLALYVDNQETWQRCKGGDHVRRIQMDGPNDAWTCDHCQTFLGKQFLVARAPKLPPTECTSPRGCLCRYEPVLEMYDDL